MSQLGGASGGIGNLFMSADHIAKQGGRYEPQRASNIWLYLDAPGGEDSHGNILALSLESFPTPKQRNTVTELPYGNESVKVAGRAEKDEMEVTLRDFLDAKTALIIHNWRALVFDPRTARIGLARNYKRSGEVHWRGPDGSTLRKAALEGVWPSGADFGDADFASDDPCKILVTFQWDRFYPLDSDWGGGLITPNGETASGQINQAIDAVRRVGQVIDILT